MITSSFGRYSRISAGNVREILARDRRRVSFYILLKSDTRKARLYIWLRNDSREKWLNRCPVRNRHQKQLPELQNHYFLNLNVLAIDRNTGHEWNHYPPQQFRIPRIVSCKYECSSKSSVEIMWRPSVARLLIVSVPVSGSQARVNRLESFYGNIYIYIYVYIYLYFKGVRSQARLPGNITPCENSDITNSLNDAFLKDNANFVETDFTRLGSTQEDLRVLKECRRSSPSKFECRTGSGDSKQRLRNDGRDDNKRHRSSKTTTARSKKRQRKQQGKGPGIPSSYHQVRLEIWICYR